MEDQEHIQQNVLKWMIINIVKMENVMMIIKIERIGNFCLNHHEKVIMKEILEMLIMHQLNNNTKRLNIYIENVNCFMFVMVYDKK